MKGGVYSDEKCPVCGETFKHYEPHGVWCPDHDYCRPAKSYVVRFGKITRRFKSYESAHRFLVGLRFKTDEGSFDLRDYRSDRPLGFGNLVSQWLDIKKTEVKPRSYRNIERYMFRCTAEWNNLNIKELTYADIEDLFVLLRTKEKLSGKTIANMRSALNSFFGWLRRRKVLTASQVPELPDVHYVLGHRRTVTKEVQNSILAKIHEKTWSLNRRIYIGVRWLCTYISIRPNELRNIKERHINLDDGYVTIPNPKEIRRDGSPKVVPLLPEDVDLARSLPTGFPEMYFFRHEKGNGPAAPGSQFGPKYLWKHWKRACLALGVEGVDLYGGTRHSSAMALRKMRTPEEIKRATMHATNKAFERYFNLEIDDIRAIYADTVSDNELITKTDPLSKTKVLKIQD